MVEQRTENPRVTGSIPVLGIENSMFVVYARVAQLVEHDLAKVGVAGSSPVSRSFYTQKGVLKKDPLLCIKRAHGARRFEVSAAASVGAKDGVRRTPYTPPRAKKNATDSCVELWKSWL